MELVKPSRNYLLASSKRYAGKLLSIIPVLADHFVFSRPLSILASWLERKRNIRIYESEVDFMMQRLGAFTLQFFQILLFVVGAAGNSTAQKIRLKLALC